MGHLPVPEDQRHLPRAERQHPYRWLDDAEREEVRAECNTLFRGIEKMVTKLIDDSAPRSINGPDRDDIAQFVWMRLWGHALARFDAWRLPRVKVTTFCYRVAYFAVIECVRRHWRFRGRRPRRIEGLALEARDESCDRGIEALADAILNDPVTYLGRWGDAVVEQTKTPEGKAIAASLGLTAPQVAKARYDARERAVSLLRSA